MTTQELTKETIELKTKVAGMSEKVDEACIRLGSVERKVEEQGKLLQSIDKLAMGLARVDEKMGDLSNKLDNFGGRINLMELKPAHRWETITMEILRYIVIAAIGYLAATLLKGV